jgi:flavin-dependent dehydrogenase
MDARLLERARAVGVDVWEEAQAVGLLLEGGRVRGARLSVRGETRECRARVTLDATGRARVLSRFLERETHAERTRRRAPLVAFKAHLEGARGASSVCEIYFYRGGYGGLSPVEGGLSNLCFIARAAEARACASDPARVMREVLMTNARSALALRDARPATDWLSVALEGFGRRAPAPAPGLLSVGDAASFIDPFTGSGMLMALESAELAAETTARRLSQAGDRQTGDTRDRDALGQLAREYSSRYEERFGARLRLCGWLRRAAFAPQALAEAAVITLGASAAARRALARATRRAAPG